MKIKKAIVQNFIVIVVNLLFLIAVDDKSISIDCIYLNLQKMVYINIDTIID
jgi:hypothetical protein